MKTSPLSRAGLILAVIASLSVGASASADTDASFISALEAIKVHLPTSTPPPKPGAPKAPTAPSDVWQKVLETAQRDAKFVKPAGPAPAMFIIEDVVGDTAGDHVKQAIAIVGVVKSDGKFHPMGALFNFKTLKREGANFRFDDWDIETDIYGVAKGAQHSTGVEDADGDPVDEKEDQLHPADPRIQAAYDAMLKHWSERTPKGE